MTTPIKLQANQRTKTTNRKLHLFVKLLFELSRDWTPDQAGHVMAVCLQNCKP